MSARQGRSGRISVGRLVFRVIALVVVVLAMVVGGFLGLTTAIEYHPADVEPVTLNKAEAGSDIRQLAPGDSLSLLTFNIGYAGLGQAEDFFMDGGKGVNPSQATTTANLAGIIESLQANSANVVFLQEVDTASKRTHGFDQAAAIHQALPGKASAYAYNFRSTYTPYPVLHMIGKVNSGIMTLTDFKVTRAERLALPVPFKWPVRLFNLKRCLLTERIPVANRRELILVNVHLEAHADDSARQAQMKILKSMAISEFAKGNYVIIGGDFNQTFPGVKFPAVSDNWQPGLLGDLSWPEGWSLITDTANATARLNDHPWDGTNQLFGIDGFILSPNVTLNQIGTVDLDFEHSDHNPVTATVTLVS